MSTWFLQLCIWQSYLQDVLEAAVQAEEGERQLDLLLVGSHHQNHQSHPHLHLPDLRHLLQIHQSRHRKRRRHCRLGG